ncbi:response regulator [Bacillus sp. 03113]|uniref:response regulator transcription factor n=1 Tax=Bacillus sp. 03113 TaxID=2578211 RepID=UPI001141E61B|nr:response regulator [Bacillus sp. 03113]
MYRILIVDDEPVIRKGITAFIDWEKEGVMVEDQYANGAEALAALKERSYDILITDIKMPLMGGIELMKQALEICPWLKVILVSNYNDFEFVKEGLKLGAVDYLLKLTLKKDDLLAVLRRCIAMLEEERKRDFELNHFQQEAVYLERKRVEQKIKRLIVQKQIPGATNWAPAWLEDQYACAYLMLDGAEEWKENHGYLYVQLLLEEWQEMFYVQMEEGTSLIVAENGLFIILPDCNGEAKQRFLEWKHLLEKQWGISTSAGFVTEHGIDNLLKGFANSHTACQRRFFEGLGGFYSIISSETNMIKKRSDREENHDWAPFYEMIRNGDPVSSAIEFALVRWDDGSLNPEQIKQEACTILTEAYHLQIDTGSPPPEWQDLLYRAETMEEMSSHLTSQLEEIGTAFTPKLAENDYDEELITKALDFIAAHYTENLTLQCVADIVHLSKSYFSLFFKKKTGRNFVDYLIDLRIREAKRLLTQDESRIYDVATASGFNDVKYFSKVFKKISGLTPNEYREKHHSTRMSIF